MYSTKSKAFVFHVNSYQRAFHAVSDVSDLLLLFDDSPLCIGCDIKTREFFSRRRMLFDLEMDGELNVAAVFFKRALYASGVIK